MTEECDGCGNVKEACGHCYGCDMTDEHECEEVSADKARIRVLEAALRAVDLAWANVQVGHEPYWVKQVREALNHA